MVNAPPLAQMRAQFEGLMDAGWATAATVSRLSGTVDAAGHVMGQYVLAASDEPLWIQAANGQSKIDQLNLDAETTHVAYQKIGGFPLLPKDRILSSGGTYYYDVKVAHVFETHRMAELKQDLRT